jgi:hypothetical protein
VAVEVFEVDDDGNSGLISNCSISHSVKKLFPELVEKGGDRTLKI